MISLQCSSRTFALPPGDDASGHRSQAGPGAALAVAAGPRITLHGRWWHGQPALVHTIASLAGTTGITALLGLAFWGLAAHLMPVAAVGYGSAAVSALTLVGTFGMAGFNTVLIAQLARRPRDAAELLTTALAASGLISAALAGGFWLLAGVLLPGIAPYLHSGPQAALFITGSALTGITLVLDEALLGLLGGGLQLLRNAAFAVTKLGALAVLAVLWHDWMGTSIPAAWTAGTAVSMAPAVVVLRRRGVRLLVAPRWEALRRLGRASVSNTWLNNALQAPRLALPLLVTGLTSAADAGAFYVAWTVVMLTMLLPNHFATALYAVSAADPRELAAKLRFTLRMCLLGGLVGVPVIVLGAHPLLRLFGASYASKAAVPLQLLTLSYFGSVLKNHYIALCRISGRISQAGVFATVTCAARLGAAAAGAVIGGLRGVAFALLTVMCAEGAFAVPAVLAGLRGRLPGGPAAGPSVRRQRAAAPAPLVTRSPVAMAAPAPAVLAVPAPVVPAATAVTVPPALAVAVPAATITPAAWPAARQPVPGSRPVRVCYYMQTHTRPAQVARLVEVIKEGSPDSVVLVSHDEAGPPLDIPRLEALPGVHVFTEPGGYGGFSHLDRYFAAIDWLDAQGIEFDWMENITGQDYPLRPIAEIERTLAGSGVDGYLLYAPVFPDRLPAGADRGAAPGFRLCTPFDAAMRYDYRNWWFGRPTLGKQRWLRPLMAVNLVQPWVRVSLAFSTIGVRRRSTLFNDDFICYGGWFFCALTAPCVRYVRDFAREHPDVVAFFRTLLGPEEVFLQTVLVNSGKFRFEPDAKRYIDLARSRNNHSKTLGVADLDAMLASGAHWARKFDPVHDHQVIDTLDRHIRRKP